MLETYTIVQLSLVTASRVRLRPVFLASWEGGTSNMAVTASEVDAHVGQRIRQRRESLGVSQGRIGRHLRLTFSQVQKYEKGSNRIGAGRLYLLADFLGVPVHYFFEGLEGAK